MGKWWLRKPMRLIQTNLREIDVRLDAEAYIASLKAYCADVVLLNTGGIAANYPTRLENHFLNPHLVNDFVGEVTRLAHENDIRVIARFDFSRWNEALALRHPEWLYKSVKGEIVNYNGQVHTCLNGYYQQQYSIDIMTEAARSYPIDGVFINMPGYVTHDYSYNYYGICQCDNCRTRFRAMYGHDALPLKEDSQDPLFRDYEKFRQQTVKELFERRSAAVKALNEDIAICNYAADGTDIFRLESNSGIDRELPEFNYASSHHVKVVRHTWPSAMAVSNAAVHFVDYAMRHAAVAPVQTAQRLAQNIVQGGWLDYYVIGTLLNQDDESGMDEVRSLYRYHQANEGYYTGLESNASVCLIQPTGSRIYGSMKEFQGIYRMLSEHHILFDVLDDSLLDSPQAAERLAQYEAAVLPDLRNMSEQACRAVDAFVEAGGKLLATGATSTCDFKGTPLQRFGLSSLGARDIVEALPLQQGTYFRVGEADKAALRGFDRIRVLYLYGEYLRCRAKEDATAYLGYIPPCMFGPPEKCYYTEVTDDPGLIHAKYGSGETALIPWGVGKHYEKRSHPGHAALLVSALRDLLRVGQKLAVEAPAVVEIMSHRKADADCDLIHAVNLSGQLGTAYHETLPIHGIRFALRSSRPIRRVRTLAAQETLTADRDGDTVAFVLPRLDLLETIVVEYGR